jgi:hypothetical protein
MDLNVSNWAPAGSKPVLSPKPDQQHHNLAGMIQRLCSDAQPETTTAGTELAGDNDHARVAAVHRGAPGCAFDC